MTGGALDSADSVRFQEACDWFVRLREQPESLELVAAWLRWCRSDPLNRDAFEEARDMWLTLGSLPVGTGAVTSSVTPRPPTTHHASRIALAAAVVAVVAGGSWWLTQNPFAAAGATKASTFVTARSEHRNVMLADGSSVEMAGDSKLSVNLREHIRDVELQQGEAYFSVAHDRARPFVVHAGSLHVRAVGTRFDVRTSEERVIVAVEEGVVVVESAPESTRGDASSVKPLRPLRVRGGQEVAVAGLTQELRVLPIEPAAVASWREGRLRFVREPLRSVISSIRAASGREIELADPELGELRFTGTLFSSHVEAWVQGLPAIFPVAVHQDGARFVIAPRDGLGKSDTQ